MLNSENISHLFPFYIFFDASGTIIEEGDQWRHYGFTKIGKPVTECFQFIQPKIKKVTPQSLLPLKNSIFLLLDKEWGLEFRFQLVQEKDSFYLCGGLSLNSNELWDDKQIEYHRFAPHDVTGDYMIFKSTLDLLREELITSGDLVTKYQTEALERKRSEHILTTLINALPTPIAISHKDGSISRSNFHFDNIFGRLENISEIQLRCDQYYHDNDGTIHTVSQNRGKTFHFTWTNSKDKVSGLQLWASNDITHLIQQQDELKIAYEKASESEKAKTRFFANMSHELRTPFNGILGVSEILLDSCDNPQHLEQLEIIHSSCESLLRIVNDILDLSKLESGKLQYEQKSFDIKVLANSVIELMSTYPHSDKTQLAYQIDPNTPKFLKGDPHRLKQVLFNIISNALKFTQEGHVHLGIKIENHSVIYTIEDTGIGMTPEQLELVFESFSQASVEISRLYGGTGLGLNISQKLIQGMGGQINVQSQIDQGTLFTITLPLVIGEAPEQNLDSTTLDPQWVGSNVIIVDDNRTNLKVLSLMLRKIGIEVLEFLSGVDLLEYLSDKPENFDLIILDIQMPILDGQQVYNQIMNKKLVKDNLPIIALTANAFKDEVQEYLDTGFDQVLSKPISKASIIQCLNQLHRI